MKGMIEVIIACLASACAGFCAAAVYNGECYDKGFDDGWRQRGIFDDYEEREGEE